MNLLVYFKTHESRLDSAGRYSRVAMTISQGEVLPATPLMVRF